MDAAVKAIASGYGSLPDNHTRLMHLAVVHLTKHLSQNTAWLGVN